MQFTREIEDNETTRWAIRFSSTRKNISSGEPFPPECEGTRITFESNNEVRVFEIASDKETCMKMTDHDLLNYLSKANKQDPETSNLLKDAKEQLIDALKSIPKI